ncbi:MAG: hypothetical protein ABI231_09625 [Candidatus Tumulicola sp.]
MRRFSAGTRFRSSFRAKSRGGAAGGGNPFELFDPAIGADFSFTDDRHGFEAHFDTLEAYTRESGIPVSGIDFMAAASKTIERFRW